MESNMANVIIAIIIALIVLVLIIRYGHTIRLKITTLLGTSFETEASNSPRTLPADRSHIKVGNIEAEKGNAEIVTQRGDRDLESGDIRAGQNVSLRDEVAQPDTDPKADPPA